MRWTSTEGDEAPVTSPIPARSSSRVPETSARRMQGSSRRTAWSSQIRPSGSARGRHRTPKVQVPSLTGPARSPPAAARAAGGGSRSAGRPGANHELRAAAQPIQPGLHPPPRIGELLRLASPTSDAGVCAPASNRQISSTGAVRACVFDRGQSQCTAEKSSKKA